MRRGETFRRVDWADTPSRESDLRYRTTDGYWCHRWNAEGVEILEHRLVARPCRDELVHPRDGDKTNTAPENLEVVSSPAEHAEHHRTVDDQTLWRLRHVDRLTLVAIGARVGLHHSQVSRRLSRLEADADLARVAQQMGLASRRSA